MKLHYKNYFLIILIFFFIFQTKIFSQTEKISIKANDEVTNILKKIEKKSEVMIKYSDTVKGKVSIDIENSSISNILEVIKKKTGLEFVPIPGHFQMMLDIKKGYFISKPDAKYFNVGWSEFPPENDTEEYHKHALKAEYGQKYKKEAWEKFRQKKEKIEQEQKKLQPPPPKAPTLEEIDYKTKYKWTDADVEKAKKSMKDKKIDIKSIIPEPEFHRIKIGESRFLVKDKKGNKIFEGEASSADAPYSFKGDDFIFYRNKNKNLKLNENSLDFDNEYKYFTIHDYYKQEIYCYDEYANLMFFKTNMKTGDYFNIKSHGKAIINGFSDDGLWGFKWYDSKGALLFYVNDFYQSDPGSHRWDYRCYAISESCEYILFSATKAIFKPVYFNNNYVALFNNKAKKLWEFDLGNIVINKVDLSKNGEYSYIFITQINIPYDEFPMAARKAWSVGNLILCINKKGNFIWQFKNTIPFNTEFDWSRDNKSMLIYRYDEVIILLDAFTGKILKAGVKD